MRRHSLILLFLALPAAAQARHALPGPHYVLCEARGNDVVATWDGLFIDATVHEAQILRDGEILASLKPEDVSYRDRGVAPGKHTYQVDVLLRGQDGGSQLLATRTCDVKVIFASGIQCAVLGGIALPPLTEISWNPVPKEHSIAGIDVERDGELIASLPPDAIGYQDHDITPGEHLYVVTATTGIVPVDPAGVVAEPPLVIGDCLVTFQPPRIGGFVRGDANADAKHDLSDAVFTLLFLFQGGERPACIKSADANDSGKLDLSDAVYTIGFLFLGTAPPPAPFPECGDDATEDELACEGFGPCFNPPPP